MRKILNFRGAISASAVLLMGVGLQPTAADAQPTTIRVTVENLAPDGGTFLTPPWVAFHDGTFDLYDRAEAVGSGSLPGGLESLAEDGDPATLSSDFATGAPGEAIDGTLPGPIAPGERRSMVFDLDGSLMANRFFSYASMVIPSNDAFIANGDPTAHPIFDDSGAFIGVDFMVIGSAVLDAGTEENDETPANTAFFGQMTPNTGADQNGPVQTHAGFNLAGSGGILDDAMFANANFRETGYRIARITVAIDGADVTTISAVGGGGIVAPDSIAAAWGDAFTTQTVSSEGVPLPTSLGGIGVNVSDSAGQQRAARLYMASPEQINFVVPAAAALGKGAITVTGGASNRTGDVLISNVAPALITVNAMGTGTAAGQAVRVNDGTQEVDQTVDDVAVGGSEVYLMLYGTGIRGRSANPVQALVNGVKVPVLYAGEQSEFPGLDQVNIGPLPASLAGTGAVNIELFVDGVPANTVTANFR